jgi:catalase (peroxidase I)
MFCISLPRYSLLGLIPDDCSVLAWFQDLLELADKTNSAPILVRLAWHDAGTFDKAKASAPFPAVRLR